MNYLYMIKKKCNELCRLEGGVKAARIAPFLRFFPFFLCAEKVCLSTSSYLGMNSYEQTCTEHLNNRSLQTVCTAKNVILNALKIPPGSYCAAFISLCVRTQPVSKKLTDYLVRLIYNDAY